MSDTHDEFLEGAHALSHRSHKMHNLRAASGYPVQYGIGAYGSPIGSVTGVQVAGGPTVGDGDNDADDHLSPDQFGNVSGATDTDGDAASAGAGGSGTSGSGGTT